MNNNQVTIKSYLIGFVLSIVLTSAAFFVVLRPGFFRLGSAGVVAAIITLALVQFFVQLTFFLHLGQESKPRWNLVVLLSTISIVLILVVGSLWIMNHLNYNMTPGDMSSYMLNQEGIQK